MAKVKPPFVYAGNPAGSLKFIQRTKEALRPEKTNMSKEMIGVGVTERVIFSDIVADTKPFDLLGGLYRIGAVISGPNNLQLQALALDGKSWIDCLDHPIATSGLSEEISIVPGQYRFHLFTDDPVSAAVTCTAR